MFVGPVNSARDPLVCTEKSKVMAQPCVNSAQQCTWSPKVETHAKKEKKKENAKCQTQVHPDPNTYCIRGKKEQLKKKKKSKRYNLNKFYI